jgi:hypothetical protein
LFWFFGYLVFGLGGGVFFLLGVLWGWVWGFGARIRFGDCGMRV